MIVYAERKDRLGGRLCAIVNGLRLACALDADFRFGWPEDIYRLENLDDVDRVLSPEFIDSYRISAAQRQALDLVRFDLFDPAAPPPQGIQVDTPAGVALLPGEDAADAARQCRELFATSAMIAPHIVAAVETLAEQLGLTSGRVAALHVRRGDVVRNYRVGVVAPEFLQRYNPIQYYQDWGARALAAGTVDRLVVFCEDADAGLALSSRLDNTRACDTAAQFPELTVLEAALVEMLLMARCVLIVGGYSAFNHFPCLIGTAHKVSIRDDLSIEERLSALEKAAAGTDLVGHEADFVSVLMLEDSLKAGRPGAVEAYIARCGGNASAMACAGAVLLESGFAAEAADLLRRALPGRPLKHAGAWRDLALALGAMGRIDEGLAAINEGLALQPTRWDLVRTRAGLLLDGGAHEAGLALMHEAVALAPLHDKAAAQAALADALKISIPASPARQETTIMRNSDMADIRPVYMDTFQCIGPECEFSCCRYWDIAVDANSAKRYRRGKTEANGHVVSEVIQRTAKGTLTMVMTEANECPILRQDGLCDLHARHGEQALPALCQKYPREVVPRATGTELHGRLSCPEVARKLLRDPDALRPAGNGAAVREAAAAKLNSVHSSVVMATEHLIEAMLTDRSKPLWCRVLDVAYLFSLMESKGAVTAQAAAPILEEVAGHVVHGTFDGKWQDVKVGPHEQIMRLAESFTQLMTLRSPHPAIADAWAAFLSLDQGKAADLCAATYTETFKTKVKPFFDARPHMLENLVIAQIYAFGLPFAFGTGSPRIASLCTLYAHVIGIFVLLSFHRGEATEEDFIRAVTVTHRHLFHSMDFAQRVIQNAAPEQDRFLPRLVLLLAEPA